MIPIKFKRPWCIPLTVLFWEMSVFLLINASYAATVLYLIFGFTMLFASIPEINEEWQYWREQRKLWKGTQ